MAVGINVEYFKVRLKAGLGVAPGAPSLLLEGDGWSVGYTAGVTITPTATTTIGIGYRSEMRPRLTGTVTNFFPAPNGIRTSIVLPRQVTIGLRQKIGRSFTLLAGLEWTNWSVFNRFNVVSTGPVLPGAVLAPLTLSFRWRDGWMASLGGEYKWDDRLTLRTGVGYEWSPVTLATRGLRLPDADRLWVSAGLTYKWSEKLSFDLGYTHIFAFAARLNITPANPTFNGVQFFGNAKSNVDIIAVGLNYKFGGKARPVVAKY